MLRLTLYVLISTFFSLAAEALELEANRSPCTVALSVVAANDNEIKILRFPDQPARLRYGSVANSDQLVLHSPRGIIRVDVLEPNRLSLKDWAHALEWASELPAYHERVQLYRAAMWRVISTEDHLTERSKLLYLLVQGATRLHDFEPEASRSILEMVSKFVVMDKLNPDPRRRMSALTRVSLLGSILAGLGSEGSVILGSPYQLLLQEWEGAQARLPAEAHG